jgi:hypothetical protein
LLCNQGNCKRPGCPPYVGSESTAFANRIRMNMNQSLGSLWQGPRMSMHCSEMIMPPSIITWRKRRDLLPMQRPSNLSSGEKMGEELGWLCLDNMQEMINGRLRSRFKKRSYIPGFGKVRATSPLRPLLPSTEMPTYRWRRVLNVSNTNSQTNIQESASYAIHPKLRCGTTSCHRECKNRRRPQRKEK